MARLKIAYLGGGSTRAPGTVASYLMHAGAFAGSTITLIDLDAERLGLVQKLAARLGEAQGADITLETTTDLEAGLTDADAVLSSFRPGGFEARYLDERIPLKHGVIGQETQGPGGFFMALRSVAVIKEVVALMERVAPKATLFNYTNPVNIVAQAVSGYTRVPVISLCEGPIVFPQEVMRGVGLEPERLETVMLGLNHACWSVKHLYDGEDVMPLLAARLDDLKAEPQTPRQLMRMLEIAVTLNTLPASYMQYYYYKDHILGELKEKATTRAQDIMASVPDYWQHYREQAEEPYPVLDPERSRGGIFELELAVQVMDSVYNDKGEVWTLNVPNRGAIAGLPDDWVVEVPCLTRKEVTPLVSGPLPEAVRGLVGALGAYQCLTAKAAWEEDKKLALQALASNPLVPSLPVAQALYTEMSRAHRAYLPAALVG